MQSDNGNNHSEVLRRVVSHGRLALKGQELEAFLVERCLVSMKSSVGSNLRRPMPLVACLSWVEFAESL